MLSTISHSTFGSQARVNKVSPQVQSRVSEGFGIDDVNRDIKNLSRIANLIPVKKDKKFESYNGLIF